MNCTNHQHREANGMCVYCGRFFCAECLMEINGKYYCKEHARVVVMNATYTSPSDTVVQAETRPTMITGVDNNQNPYPAPAPLPAPYPEMAPPPPPYPTQGLPPDGLRRDGSNPTVVVNNNMYGYGYSMMPVSPKSRMVALLLCIFFGCAGFHRFYAGKIGTGLIWLFTGGLCGIGYIVDIIMIIAGSFRDDQGRQITIW